MLFCKYKDFLSIEFITFAGYKSYKFSTLVHMKYFYVKMCLHRNMFVLHSSVSAAMVKKVQWCPPKRPRLRPSSRKPG